MNQLVITLIEDQMFPISTIKPIMKNQTVHLLSLISVAPSLSKGDEVESEVSPVRIATRQKPQITKTENKVQTSLLVCRLNSLSHFEVPYNPKGKPILPRPQTAAITKIIHQLQATGKSGCSKNTRLAVVVSTKTYIIWRLSHTSSTCC